MLRTSYTVALMLAVLLGGTYWYTAVEAVCKLPVYYQLGEVDERFGLTRDEARTALSDAESIWEQSTGRNLFTYDDEANLRVNFIYDDRQRSADAAEVAKGDLNSQEEINETLSETYARLVKEYKNQELIYEDRRAAFERRLNNYNAEVERYNNEGGAPPEEYERLENEKQALDAERDSVNAMAAELNELSDRINEIGEQGNELIRAYNNSVRRFNDTFGSSEEFTQGDFQGREINIYTFSDGWELRLVLAHELGHTLSIDHVENEESIMYYLLGEQPGNLTLTSEDLAEFQAVCGDVSTYERLRDRLQSLLNRLRP